MTFDDILTSKQWLTKCRKYEPILYRELYSEFCMTLFSKKETIEQKIQESEDERCLLAWAYCNGTLKILARMPNSSFNRFWKYKEHDPLDNIILIDEPYKEELEDLHDLAQNYIVDGNLSLSLMAYDLYKKLGDKEEAAKSCGMTQQDFNRLLKIHLQSLQYGLF